MRKLLFSMDVLQLHASEGAVVGGRNCGDEIRAGDVAQSMVRLGDGEVVLATESVAITMRSFLAYGRSLDAVDSGMSAAITVDSEAARGLRLGWYLKGQNA